MDITEIRVKMVGDNADRLKAFCSITIDSEFVIRDLKVIDGINGIFVAMPSRKLADRCPKCGYKNHLRAHFCNDCGTKLGDNRAAKDLQGRAKLHADVAHPINAVCRDRVQKAVIEAYQDELQRSQEPGYAPPKYDDDLDDDEATATDYEVGDAEESSYESLIADLKKEAQARRGGAPRPEHKGRDKGQRREGGRRGQPRRPAREEPPTPSPAAPVAGTDDDAGQDEDNEFGKSIFDKPRPETPAPEPPDELTIEPAPAPEVEAPREISEPTEVPESPSGDEESDDDSAFGTGIL